jgi:hypothetical protein
MNRLVLLIIFIFPEFANARSGVDLIRSGYEVIWEGYSKIETCVHDNDSFKIGRYIFVCDKFTYAYPYHYGNSILLIKKFQLDGGNLLSTYVCMEGKDECLEGTIYLPAQ